MRSPSPMPAVCSADIKAIDFGVSTFCKPNQHFSQRVGSAYYVAPEVLRKDYTFRADLWSLGVVLYVLLSGLPPFWGDERGSGTERQIFQMILAGSVDLKSEPWPSISHAAKDLVRRLLSMDAGARCVHRCSLPHAAIVTLHACTLAEVDHSRVVSQ